MCRAQQLAWYSLGVLALSLVTMLAVLPALGVRAAAVGFAPLGLLGLSPLIARGKRGVVVADERDAGIQRRATAIAYSVFWVVFVLAAALGAPAIYGLSGSVPVVTVQCGVFAAFALFQMVHSVSVLLQYGGGGGDAD